MENAVRAALSAWQSEDPLPLVRLFGFRPNGGPRGGAVATVGRSGTSVAVVLRCPAADALAAARRVRNRDPLRQHLFLCRDGDARRLELIAFGPDGEPRRLAVDAARIRAADIDTLCEMTGRGEQGIALALRHTRALDRARVTRRFFEAFRAMRARVAADWTGLPPARRRERERLALLFLCRLMFLYFLERDGRLAGRTDYFRWLRQRHARRPRSRSFYRDVLIPLFHGALNRRPEQRTKAAQRLGTLPYLNGGLFERDAVERRYMKIDLPLATTDAVFDELLERYRFTTREHATSLQDDAGDRASDYAGRNRAHHADDGAVDPEMLGRVFEGLMDAEERGRTGTFYTPAPLVDEVVRHALTARIAHCAGVSTTQAAAWLRAPHTAPPSLDTALHGLRALDPACGSGAFLVGLLIRLARLRQARGADADLPALVGEALHGVDLQDDAALLCALRLWLTLAGAAGRTVPPLPNLDRRIRQGDALLDPLDLHGARDSNEHALALDEGFRSAVGALTTSARAYLSAEPAAKQSIARRITRQEHALARTWIETQLGRLARREAELRAAIESTDLFGHAPAADDPLHARLERVRTNQRELKRLRTQLRRHRGTPFFSFLIHFADAMQEGGFDLVVSNPPWVRAHRWPQSTTRLVRERYTTCAGPGWRYGTDCVGVSRGVAAQVDMAVLFLERALRLLAPGGVVAMLLPAKILRSLYAAGTRRLLLEQADVLRVDDRSLDMRACFDADAFVMTLIARRKPETARASADRSVVENVEVSLYRAGTQPLACPTPVTDLPLIAGDPAAPWLIAPPAVRAVLRRMQKAGGPLGRHDGMVVRRGVMTGANDVLVLREVEQRLGGLSRVRALGSRAEDDAFSTFIESDCVRPLLRGTDIRAWQRNPTHHVIWMYDEHLRLRAPQRHIARYLSRHREVLSRRAPNAPIGCLFRVSPALLDSLVLWRDLATDLQAVTLPRNAAARPVPLNSVYFASPGRDDNAAYVLAAYLNSLPVRVFARTIAERAKDGFFRFFAWTVAVLPLVADWRSAHANELAALSRAAHENGDADADTRRRIDGLVARNYGLRDQDLDVLREFDDWLTGGSG